KHTLIPARAGKNRRVRNSLKVKDQDPIPTAMCQYYGALHKCIGAMHISRFKSAKLKTIYGSHKRCMNDETSEQDDEPDQQLPQLAPLPRDRERVEPPLQPRAQRSWYLPQRHSICSTEVLILRIQSFVGFLLLPNPTDATDHL